MSTQCVRALESPELETLTMNRKPRNLNEALIVKERSQSAGRRRAAAVLWFWSSAASLAAALSIPGCVTAPWRMATVLPGYSFDYKLQNREATGLIQVFDDGQKTYLQFADWNHGSPSIMDSHKMPLSFERSGAYAVVAGRHRSLIVSARGAESVANASSLTLDSSETRATVAPATPTVDEVQHKQAEVDTLRGRIDDLQQQLAAARAALLSYADMLVIHFANNSAKLNLDHETVQAMAEVVREQDVILITGYTDATYPDAAGEFLARRRAQNVQRALLAEGIPAAGVDVIYHAAGLFAVDNHSPEGKALNRRVEITTDRNHARPPG